MGSLHEILISTLVVVVQLQYVEFIILFLNTVYFNTVLIKSNETHELSNRDRDLILLQRKATPN